MRVFFFRIHFCPMFARNSKALGSFALQFRYAGSQRLQIRIRLVIIRFKYLAGGRVGPEDELDELD